MDQILQLWLPIVVSAAFVFIASAAIWMATPMHKNDYKNLGDKEDAVLSVLKNEKLAPGIYCVPWMMCEKGADQKAATERYNAGPWATLAVSASKPSFPMSLILWFINCLLISAMVGYITFHTLPNNPHYLKVFQAAGTAATLAYCGYLLPLAAWHSVPMKQLPAKFIDGMIYACVTAGTFGWLWPKVEAAVKPVSMLF